ncbi:MAG: hypothetical protein KJ955_01570 [Nanoarchaeota archaeon]|nr:hypothetical protein [Nanoarchaeota archaeon]
MAYLSEIHACRWIKDPVKLYISFTAADKHAALASDIAVAVTKVLQEDHRAYLSKYAGFAGKKIVYADSNPDSGSSEHENWHIFLERRKLSPAAGEFIEEASSYVIDDLETDKSSCQYLKHLNWSQEFVKTYLAMQNRPISELETILRQFAGIVPEWNEEVMKGSCPWMRFTDEAKYFLLYHLCFDIAFGRTMQEAKRIYATSLKITKKKGVAAGIRHLRRRASKAVSDMYDFDFDIGGYYPNYPSLVEYRFFGKEGMIIEACGKYSSWIAPLEREIKKRGLVQDK